MMHGHKNIKFTVVILQHHVSTLKDHHQAKYFDQTLKKL